MLDMKLLRKDPVAIETRLKSKDPTIDLTYILALDEEVRHLKTKAEKSKADGICSRKKSAKKNGLE